MSRRLTVALAAAALVTSTSAAAWEPAIVGFDDGTVNDASPATDTSPVPAAYAAAARVTPEMVSEAAVAGDAVAEADAPPAYVAAYARFAGRVTPEMVSEAAVADDAVDGAVTDAAQARAAATAGDAKDMPELGSGAAEADTEQSPTLRPTSAR